MRPRLKTGEDPNEKDRSLPAAGRLRYDGRGRKAQDDSRAKTSAARREGLGRDGNVEGAEAGGIGDDIGLDNLPVGKRKDNRAHKVAMWSHNQSDGAIHQGWPHGSGRSCEGNRASSPLPRAMNLSWRTGPPSGAVDVDHDIGIEDRDEPIDIAGAQRTKKGVHNLALPPKLDGGTL